MENRIKALEREIELLTKIKELEEAIAKLKLENYPKIVYFPQPTYEPYPSPPWVWYTTTTT